MKADVKFPDRPKFEELRPLPLLQSTRVDKYQGIEGVLAMLEQGYFHDPALLFDGMLRDDRIHGVLNTRTHAIASLPLKLIPASRDPQAIEIAEEFEEKWPRVFPDWKIAEMLRFGLGLGVSPVKIDWVTEKGFYVPKLEIWHPFTLRWSWMDYDFRIYHTEGESVIEPNTGEWMLYTPFGNQYGWRRSLMFPLSYIWLMRGWTRRDWARASEVYGIPIRKLKVPEGASDAKKRAYLHDIAKLGNEGAILLPQSKEPSASWDVDLLQVTADMHKAFEDFLGDLNIAVAVIILGQNLTTEVSEGSRAAAQVHNSVRADRLGADAETMAATLYEQVLRPWAAFNFGDPDLAPWPQWQVEPPQDQALRASTLKTLAEAVAGFQASGAQVNVTKLLSQFDVPLTEVQTEEPDEPDILPEGAIAEGMTEELKQNQLENDRANRLKTVSDALVQMRRAGAPVDYKAVMDSAGIATAKDEK